RVPMNSVRNKPERPEEARETRGPQNARVARGVSGASGLLRTQLAFESDVPAPELHIRAAGSAARMVAKGSLVKVEYEAWTEEGELFDTTKRDVAKQHDKFNEQVVYEPLPVLVGSGRVIPGFDEALQAADVGKEQD